MRLNFIENNTMIKGMKGVDKNWFIDSIDPETKFCYLLNIQKQEEARTLKQ